MYYCARITAATKKTTISDHQGMLKVIQHALTIANFTTDRPALLEINRKIATMGGGAIIIVSKNRPLFFGCFRSSEKLGLPPKKPFLAGALELDPLVSGGDRYYALGCYIPPNNLTTLTHIEAAWNECPKGHIPIMLGNLNIKLASPRNERDELIAEQVGDVMGLVDVSRQFKQHRQVRARDRWTWRMRRGGRWVSSQCDYFLGREIERGRFCSIGLRIPSHHDSDHCAIVAKIYSGSEKQMKA
jgi:hypothetical protein